MTTPDHADPIPPQPVPAPPAPDLEVTATQVLALLETLTPEGDFNLTDVQWSDLPEARG